VSNGDFKKHDQEEDYFRKQDRELIERMRRAAAAEQAQQTLREKSGIQDPDLLAEIAQLGFTAETVSLLPLVPILQVAWADAGISAAERSLLLEVARGRGVTEGSPADTLLGQWLTERPSPDVFSRAGRLINAMLTAHGASAEGLSPDDLVNYCERIAAASGGILGVGKVSASERAAIEQIQIALRAR
jgi:hypothetical protein